MPRFRVLGPLAVHAADGTPIILRSRRQRRLIAVLVARAGRLVTADELVEAGWGDALPANPTATLQTQVHRLRLQLGSAAASLTTHAGGYRLDVEPGEIDAVRFERLVERARGCNDAAAAIADLDAALDLWRGHAYGELADHELLVAEASRLDDVRVAAQEDRAERLLAAGRAGDAALASAVLARDEPYRERPVAVGMRALVEDGRHVDAVRLYDTFRRRLRDELGVEPSPELRALEREILRPETRRAPAVGVPGNSFVGREHELAAVAERLRGPARLVTLTGPGGVGKTRLATHVAAQLHGELPDGLYVCELAPVTDASAVAAALAAVLGVQASQGQQLLDRVVDVLQAKRALVVLDNCEHVRAAVAVVVRELLARAPEVVILATSRQRLGVEGEHVVAVRPLPVGGTARGEPAVALFVDRAAAAGGRHGFAADEMDAVRTLCQRLAGLPLAIELAAARGVAYTPAELSAALADRLDSLADQRRVVDRHRSFDAAMDWSYGLLPPAEQDLFRRLSVFAGGFTTSAVTAVVGLPGELAAGRLADLVEHSLATVAAHGGRTRFAMLEPVRQYAEARLATTGALTGARAAHASWAVEWLEAADAGLRTPDEARWVTAVDDELPNLRAAHRWALDHDLDLARRLVAAAYWYAYFYAPAEVLEWADRTVAAPLERRSRWVPGAFATAALAAWRRGDVGRARALGEQAVAWAPGAAEARFAWEALRSSAVLAGDYALSLQHRDRAMALARRAGDRVHEAHDHVAGALALGYLGRLDDAHAELATAASVLAEIDSPTVSAFHDYVAGEIRVDAAPADALPLLERSRRKARQVGNRFIAGIAGLSAVSCAARLGGGERALGEYAEVIDHFHRAGAWAQLWTSMRALVETLTHAGRSIEAATIYGAMNASAAAPDVRGGDAVRLAGVVATLRAALGEQRYGELIGRGAELGDERAVAFALAAAR